MSDHLLSGINHVALAASDVDVTVAFYCDAFGLEATDFSVGEDRSVLLLFPNGSFVQVLEAGSAPIVRAPVRAEPGNLVHEGAPLDHFSLFAVDTDALDAIRDRLVALEATDGVIIDTAGVARTVRFTDPDGRLLEVTAYPKR